MTGDPQVSLTTIDHAIRVAEGVEQRSVGSTSDSLLLAAVSSALLREGVAALDEYSGVIGWVALSCRPEEPASWMASEPAATSGLDGAAILRPAELPPDYLEKVIGTGDGTVQLSAVAKPPAPLGEVDYVYKREWQLTGLAGTRTTHACWLVGSTTSIEGPLASAIDGILSQSERLVGDRLTFGIGGYRPIATVLAAVDDEFQHALLRAREVDGLAEFFARLDDGGAAAQIDIPQEAQVTEAPAIGDVDADSVRDLIAERYQVGAKQMRLYLEVSSYVTTDFGRWHGLAEVSAGLGGMRTRRVLIQVVTDAIGVHRALGRYFALAGRARHADLAILCVGLEPSDVEALSSAWHDTNAVYLDVL